MIFLLKSHRPAVYNVPQRNEHSGPDGKPIETENRVMVYIPDNGRGDNGDDTAEDDATDAG